MSDLQWLTAGEIAAAYAARRLSPVELVRALLARIETYDPQVNAFIKVDGDAALDAARQAEQEIMSGRARGPLHGIPIGIKDIIDIAGLPTTCHSKILMDNIARSDAHVIGRLRAAGSILLGKLSLHEFAYGGPSKELPFSVRAQSLEPRLSARRLVLGIRGGAGRGLPAAGARYRHRRLDPQSRRQSAAWPA